MGARLIRYLREILSEYINRNLFDKPVSHVVQWTAIKHLKETGRRWHYVGQRFILAIF